VLKTKAGTITLNALPGVGGVTIETAGGMKIEFTMLGLTITNGKAKISMMGPKVSINDTALEVMF
jgi:hypothetical protein